MERQKEKEDMEERKASVRDAIVKFMGYTTAHGFGRLVSARSLARKLFWILAIMVAFGMFASETFILFQLYLSRPVQTSVSIQRDKELTFPAVTICNLNKIKKSSNTDLPDHLQDLINNFDEHSGAGSGNDTDDFDHEDSASYGNDEVFEGDEEYPDPKYYDNETKIEFAVENYLSSLPDSSRMLLGHDEKKMIEGCTWKGLSCRNFSKFWRKSWDNHYGNCFTFNDGRNNLGEPTRVLKTSKPGPFQGLTLELFVEPEEYFHLTGKYESGVRVVLHEQGLMPFPDEGFNVGSNEATSVGLRKKRIKRVDRFGDRSCSEEGVTLAEDNLYREYKNISRYSFQACLNSCLGDWQIEFCDCVEAAYPSRQPCDLADSTTRECLRSTKRLFSTDQQACTDICKRPCREEIYEMTISSSEWNSHAKSEKSSEDEEVERNGVLYLRIFYSQLSYEVIEETFSYGTTKFLADIGGQLGLWIGLSFLTVIEMLELTFEIIVAAYKKLKNRKQNQAIESTSGRHL